jgi:hypothetical protein
MNATETIRVGSSGERVLVDAPDYKRLRRMGVYRNGRYVCVRTKRAGRARLVSLARYLVDAPPGVMVRHRNGDPLDCRRENLRLDARGNVVRDRNHATKPWQVRVAVDGRSYYCGHWPRRDWAEEVGRLAAECATGLRGQGLARRAVQRALDLATGREIDEALVRAACARVAPGVLGRGR